MSSMITILNTAGPAGYTLSDLVTTTVTVAVTVTSAAAWIARLLKLRPTIQDGLTNPGIVFTSLAAGLLVTSVSVHIGYIYPV
jgi:hypothetical protein